MADTTANINLITTGGDAAASEIGKATQAMNTITSSSSALQSNFQERFQHIGLQIFAGQALSSIGLSGETRQAVMLMNTALTASEAAGGIASGGMTLLITALVAVAAAVYEVVEKHENLVASLDKVIESQQVALKSTNDDIDAARLYSETIGGADGVLGASEKLAAYQQGELLTSERDQLKAIQDEMAANVTHAKILSLLQDAYELYASQLKTATTYVLQAIPGVGTLVSVYELLKDKVSSVTSALSLGGVQYGVNSQQADILAGKNDVLQVKMEKLLMSIQNGGASWDQLAAHASAASDQMGKDIDALQAAHDKFMADSKKTDDEVTRYAIEQNHKQEEAMKQSLEKQQAEVRKFSTTVGNDFGGMFKEMVIQGESFNKAFQQMMDKMLEQFVDYILDMTVKWVAEQTVQGVQAATTQASVTASVASGASANVGIWSSMVSAMVTEWEILKAAILSNPYTAASEPAAASAQYSTDSGIAGGMSSSSYPMSTQAIGGSVFADTPTLAMFGEAGPELATFSPMGSSSASSSGGAGAAASGGTQNNEINITIQGGMVDQNTINKIGQVIVQAIRGQGQISFA